MYGQRRDSCANIYPNALAQLREETDLQHLLVARIEDVVLLVGHEAVVAIE
jgi:hypothetical protein